MRLKSLSPSAEEAREIPLRLRIEPGEEYLHVQVSGEFDLARTKDLIRHVLSVARQQGLCKIFVDRREMSGPVGDLEQFQLAEFVAKEQGGENFRTAILKRMGLIGLDRFFETVAVNRGAILKVTTDMEEAFKWLDIKRPSSSVAAA